MKKKLGDILKIVVFLGIGLFFIYWFLLKLDPEERGAIWESFISAKWGWVVAVIAVSLFSHLFRALRWRLLFKPLNYNVSLNHTFGAVMVAYLANLAVPRLGEVLRCAMLRSSDGIQVEKSLGTVVTERLVDMLLFALVVVLGFLAMFGEVKDFLYEQLSQKFTILPTMATLTVIAVALAIAAFILYKLFKTKIQNTAIYRKTARLVRGCIDGIKSIFHLGPKAFSLFIVYSIVIYLLYIAGGWVIFQAFDATQHLGFQAAFVVYLFGSVGMMISQGGLGAYPVLVWQALSIYGIDETTGLATGWLLWSSQQALVVAVGLVYLIYFALAKKKKCHGDTINTVKPQSTDMP